MMKILSIISARARLFVVLLFVSISSPQALAGFGLSTSNTFFTVDTGNGLVFKVRRVSSGSSTHSPGDIESLKIDGIEYQSPYKGSQINSGFDWLYNDVNTASVAAQKMGDNTIKITVTAGRLTHYYMARRNERRIYMATYFSEEPTVAPYVRYLFRIRHDRLPNGPEPANLTNVVGTIESADIYKLANGETRSKHYSNERAKDWRFIGGTGNGVGIWVVRDNFEGGNSGPFYRSLLIKNTKDTNEITYMMNYNQAQTEAFRTGILHHYTMVVTDGRSPETDIDTSWFKAMDLKGYVPNSRRGSVSGSGFYGMTGNYHYTVGFSNRQAQYWTMADDQSGAFSSPNMLPGRYTMTLYKNELALLEQPVTIEAGKTTQLASLHIDNDPRQEPVLWRVGHWDGTPTEFLNGDKITTMHPSDVRMANWNTPTFVVGTSSSRDFPAYIWKSVNNDRQIEFTLSKSQSEKSHVVRVGITVAYAGARPQIRVNNWGSNIPAKSVQPTTRTITVGTYRGNNTRFEFTVPASALKAGKNVLTISVASGSSGVTYLSPSFGLDAVDMLQ